MNLYIDTNILLSFYHLSSEDLEELHKLVVLLDQERLALHLPDQVVNEFRRNRDSKITDAVNKFRAEKLNNLFPQICKEYEEYKQMRDTIKQFEEAKSQLLEKLTVDISREELKADKIIEELFAKAKRILVTDEILKRAKGRYDLGNPPGKKGSCGDAVNWECLLSEVADNEDLYFISDDRDYCALSNEEEFCHFLRREWNDKKAGRIVFFKRLSAFFKDQFPNIQLAKELEKELLIKDLANSHSFTNTSQILRKLVKFSDFTAVQLNDIVSAAISNNQVYWIIQDNDINEYFKRIVKGNENGINPDNLEKFYMLLGSMGYEKEEEPPF
jgi:predicted nucleic acid-binding protein